MSLKRSAERLATFPVLVMTGFTGLLFLVLAARVYMSDRDLALDRVREHQARLAAESGIHFALARVRNALVQPEPAILPGAIVPQAFESAVQIGRWRRIGGQTEAWFRVAEIRRVQLPDRLETPLIDESCQLQVTAEGRCGWHLAQTTAVVQLTDLVRTFGAMNSLNMYYYGTPLQPWIDRAGSLEAFMALNPGPFRTGALSPRGLIFDPRLLARVYQPAGEEPFLLASGTQPVGGSYGRFFAREGESPCRGPVYCQTPIVVDTHRFFGPVQTAGWLFRRGGAKPVIDDGRTVVALTSSRRVQLATDNLEGEMPPGSFVDQDASPNSSFVASWKPDFAALKAAAKRTGIYIDENGKGFYRGEAVDTDYHPGDHHLFSETYVDAATVGLEQDEVEGGYVVLSTAARYGERNNLDAVALRGARLVFSERSVYIRGEIGGDLLIVTPKHIFLTGSTNDEGPFSLFLVAGAGVALSTTDLENHVAEKKPSQSFISAAVKWKIRAVIYKPGAGWYGSWSSSPSGGKQVWPSGLLGGRVFTVTIEGACIEGNLKRWIDHAAPDGVRIEWKPAAADRLPVQPITANLLRMKTVRLN
ncbi:MAG TPA: hypothetical protein VIV61_12695 [Candidatus Ozemobacteraceae bacterium]